MQYYANYGNLFSPVSKDVKALNKFLCFFFVESADSSSSDDDSVSDAGNPSSSKDLAHVSHLEQNESPSQSPTRFPIPSTSTGITSNGNISLMPSLRTTWLTHSFNLQVHYSELLKHPTRTMIQRRKTVRHYRAPLWWTRCQSKWTAVTTSKAPQKLR